MKLIRTLKPVGGQPQGAVLELFDSAADHLIKTGAAVPITPGK